MEYQILRGTGMRVSRICLGTMTFGDQADEATSIKMVETAIDAGVNFIDTADAYTKGRSEEITGKALKGKRDKVILASKVANLVGKDRSKDQGLNRWHVIKGVEASLKRLKTDCLDIFYLHKPDWNTPIEETMAAFDMLVQQGKVMYVGMSNFASWQVMKALWKCDVHNWAPPVVLQLPYNIITRSIDEECVSFSKEMNIGMTVYNPLAAGMLTGKYSRDAAPSKDTRLGMNKDYYGRFWHDRNFEAMEMIEKIADDAGKTMIELALQWQMSQPIVDSMILGASKLEHLEHNIQAADGRLEEDTLKACDDVWQHIRGGHFAYNR
ncbi:MAG: aldo/keto reductase [Candidatus Latescibacteria bacterium]|jgi:1-deoxyxylulose-5-phosphate synthase|nr:aldo/keto reductase [Candidatus Latescibacterota bacterium]MBT5830237.1 aldo/keto reductase [Candidatus Latescibacterota bacterium]